MNICEVNGIAFLGSYELELSSEIRPLVIHGKVVIDCKSGAVIVPVGFNSQLSERIRVGDNTSFAITEVILGDRSQKCLAPSRTLFSPVNEAQRLVQTVLGGEPHPLACECDNLRFGSVKIWSFHG